MIKAILDPQFQPMVVVLDEYIEAVKKAENTAKLTIGVERNKGFVSTFELDIYADGTGHDEENYGIAERIIKTMLWTKGGWKVIIHGSKYIADRIAADYKVGGAREFDAQFMARVYEKPFEVEGLCSCCPAPKTFETSNAIGRHLDGCRIGFDAGGSDRKVSAVINGESVYSEEVVWFPKITEDPNYHYNGILEAMKTAASKMPRVDAIGVSSAGVYVDNKIMVASLFLKVSDEEISIVSVAIPINWRIIACTNTCGDRRNNDLQYLIIFDQLPNCLC